MQGPGDPLRLKPAEAAGNLRLQCTLTPGGAPYIPTQHRMPTANTYPRPSSSTPPLQRSSRSCCAPSTLSTAWRCPAARPRHPSAPCCCRTSGAPLRSIPHSRHGVSCSTRPTTSGCSAHRHVPSLLPAPRHPLTPLRPVPPATLPTQCSSGNILVDEAGGLVLSDPSQAQNIKDLIAFQGTPDGCVRTGEWTGVPAVPLPAAARCACCPPAAGSPPRLKFCSSALAPAGPRASRPPGCGVASSTAGASPGPRCATRAPTSRR